jgi:hypothetical protein
MGDLNPSIVSDADHPPRLRSIGLTECDDIPDDPRRLLPVDDTAMSFEFGFDCSSKVDQIQAAGRCGSSAMALRNEISECIVNSRPRTA